MRSKAEVVPALLLGLGVALVCLAFVHATQSGAYWTGDCANKALVASRLLETGFRDARFDHPAAAVDPAWRAFPLPHLGIAPPHGSGRFSVFPLAYPALAAPFLALLGPPGLRWPAALGAGACAALYALWLAPVYGRRIALGAGAVLGLATPLFFYGVTVWEHSLTVALVLGAALGLQRSGRTTAMAAGASLGVATWLREELVLMGLAVVLVEHLRTRDLRRTLALCAGGGALGAALAVFNARLYGSVLGPHAAALDPALAWQSTGAIELATRFASLVVGRADGPTAAWALTALCVCTLAASAFLEWRGHGRRVGLLAAAAAGLALWGIAVARIVQGPPLLGLVSWNGLVPQIPLVSLCGIGAVRLLRSDLTGPLRPAVYAGLLFLLLAVVAGLATQSVFGMGLHVGPRKLLPALPALLTLALAAVAVPGAPPRGLAGAVPALLVAAGIGSSALAGALLHHQKAEAAALQDIIRSRPERYVISGDAMLTQALTALWRDTPLLYTPRVDVLRDVITGLRANGSIGHFLVIASGALPLQNPALGFHCRRLLHHRGAVVGYWDTDVLTCALGRR